MENLVLRERIQKIGGQGLDVIEGYFDGTRTGSDKVAEALQMVKAAMKVEHMNQIKEQVDKSLALRFIKYLPQDKEMREEYIKQANPVIEKLMLARPKLNEEKSKK